MELNYKGLKKLVDKAGFDEYEHYEFSGMEFMLFHSEYTEDDKTEHRAPVFYMPSSVVDWDIYFGMNVIPEEFRKPVLLHEIAEIVIYKSLFGKGLTDSEKFKRAHSAARNFDDLYAKESFDKPKYQRFCEFRQKCLNGL